MELTVTILGCGSSSGVPMIGCECSVCTSNNPKNKRLRASIWLKTDTTSILIDTSPDLRQQALRAGIKRLDAVIYTHDHADHLHGVDELRSFNYAIDAPIPAYMDAATLNTFSTRFSYVLQPKPEPFWYRPCIAPQLLDMNQLKPFMIGDIPFQPFKQIHGAHEGEPLLTLGFRVGNFAYSTDVNEIPGESFDVLNGVDYWLVDCLRYRAAPTHANLETALAWIDRVKPKKAILTHMSHQLDYDILQNEVPNGVEPAYDGMTITANI